MPGGRRKGFSVLRRAEKVAKPWKVENFAGVIEDFRKGECIIVGCAVVK